MQYVYYILILIFVSGCTDQTEANFYVENQNTQFRYAKNIQIDKRRKDILITIIDHTKNQIMHRYEIPKSELPLARLAVLSATHIGMISELNKLDAIVSYSDMQWVHNKAFIKRFENGYTSETGDFGLANLETFLHLKPDAIIYSGFDENNPILKKIHAANIRTIANYEWKETNPLGRAEWIKFFGVLLNEEEAADSIFNAIEKNYLELTERIAKDATNTPTVFVGTPYGDQFDVPAGESYMATILKDLKVDYRYANTLGVASHTYSLEKVISENASTDYWLNPAAVTNDDILQLNRKFELLNAVKTGRVYSYYASVNKFWEESALRPDFMLHDLAAIFHPELFENNEFHYYSVVK
jgi:iron complex transport system substrate-binding protein